jgi:hypothetical protein
VVALWVDKKLHVRIEIAIRSTDGAFLQICVHFSRQAADVSTYAAVEIEQYASR